MQGSRHLLELEAARHAVYQPCAQNDMERMCDGTRILDMISYNFLMGRHTRNTNKNEILVSHWRHLTTTATRVLLSNFEVVARLNQLRGAARATNDGEPRPYVRTFVETLFANDAAAAAGDPIGLRVYHVLVKGEAASAASATGNPSSGTTVRAARSAMDAIGDSDEEESADAMDDNEDETADGGEAPPAGAKRKVKLFVDGFREMIRGNVKRRRDAHNEDLKKKVKSMTRSLRNNDALFSQTYRTFVNGLLGTTPIAYHSNVLLPYLEQDACRIPPVEPGAELNEHDFVDGRGFWSPTGIAPGGGGADGQQGGYPSFRGQLNPERVLGMETRFTYHTQGVSATQLDPRSYYRVRQEVMLALATGPDEPPPGADEEELARHLVANRNSFATKFEEYYCRSVHRIENLGRTAIGLADFRGFPHPESVYEVPMALCVPEIIYYMPLPVTLGYPMPVLGARGLHTSEYEDYVVRLMCAAEVFDKQANGAPAAEVRRLFTGNMASVRARVMQQRVRMAAEMHESSNLLAQQLEKESYILVLARRIVEMLGATARYGRVSGDSFMLGGVIYKHWEELRATDEEGAARSLMNTVRDLQNALLHASVERDDHNYVWHVRDRIKALQDRESDIMEQTTSESRDAGAASAAPVQGDAYSNFLLGGGLGTPGDDGEVDDDYITCLPDTPPEIVDRDDALKLRIQNLNEFAKLKKDFVSGGKGINDLVEYQQRHWTLIQEAAERADNAFMTSENVSDAVKNARAWFLRLSPAEKQVRFEMGLHVRPYSQARIWLNESLASAAVNVTQNCKTMVTIYFSRLHHCRWYPDPKDPHLNVLMAGDGAAGKSFMLNQAARLSPPGIVMMVTHMSTHALNVPKNNDDVLYMYHEFQNRYLFETSSDKSSDSNDAINFFKDRLTRGRVTVIYMDKDAEGNRVMRILESSCQSVTIGGTNASLAKASEHVLTRFNVISVPKPREQAPGTNPADRPDNDDIDDRTQPDSTSQRTVLDHQLVHFRILYTEFMIKAGVIPGGVMTFAGRVLMDNILNDLRENYAIETRDVRKRKMTEEMAREMAIFYANWMGLGSILARIYVSKTKNSVWSVDAFLNLVLPFLFVTKDHVVDALTLMDGIWAPEHFNKILSVIAFEMIQLHKMKESCFAPVHSDMNDGLTGAAIYTGQGRYNFNYIVFEDSNYKALCQNIANRCSRFGVRAADVDELLEQMRKRYVSTHHLVEDTAGVGAALRGSDVPLAAVLGQSNSMSMAPELHGEESMEAARLEELYGEGGVGLMGGEDANQGTPAGAAQAPRIPQAAGNNVRLCFDTTRAPIHIPMFRSELKNAKNPRGNHLYFFSLQGLMRRLSFNVLSPASLQSAAKLYTTVAQEVLPPLRPRATSFERKMDYQKRSAVAAEMAMANGKSASPLVKCIANVLENRYLEQPDPRDVVHTAFMKRIETIFEKHPVHKTYPWQEMVVSLAVRDYRFKSKNTERYPNGRIVSMYDLMQVLYLSRKEENATPIHRSNYTRATVYTAQVLENTSLREVERAASTATDAMDIDDDEEEGAGSGGHFIDAPVSGQTRAKLLAYSKGIRFLEDIDYLGARERMNSLCHPGMTMCPEYRLIAWPPVTFAVVAGLGREASKRHLTTEGKIPKLLNSLEDYPEWEEERRKSYPIDEIINRIRTNEEDDRLEANKSFDHFTSAASIFATDSTFGNLTFGGVRMHSDATPGALSGQTQLSAEQQRELNLLINPVSMFNPNAVFTSYASEAEDRRARGPESVARQVQRKRKASEARVMPNKRPRLDAPPAREPVRLTVSAPSLPPPPPATEELIPTADAMDLFGM